MKKSIRIILIIAVVLLVAGAGVCANTPVQTETSLETQHENTEYQYNEDGQISKIIYYDNDVLQGSTDYVYTDDYTCIIHFDKNNEQTGYEQTNYNVLKNPTKYIEKKLGELVTSIIRTNLPCRRKPQKPIKTVQNLQKKNIMTKQAK